MRRVKWTTAEYLFIAIASRRRAKKAGISSYYLAPSRTCRRAGLIELRDAYASFRITRGKIVAEDGVDSDEENTRGDRFNVDSPRSNVNAFSQKLPADCKVRYILLCPRFFFSPLSLMFADK